MNYYIYYRVTLAEEEFKLRVRAMQRELQRETGIQGQLLKGKDTTWMEVYEAVEDRVKFEASLEHLKAVHRLEDAAVDGKRFTERFEPV